MLRDEVKESAVLEVLGTNIRQFRAHFELSQADLAEQAGISITFLSDIERGRKWISLRTMIKFANIFNVEIYELLKPLTGWPADCASLLGKYYADVSYALEKIHHKYLVRTGKRQL
ncbi:MAG: helix-turn-helix domain-containing protein [Candidatus Margulisbacteria bacterium]|jgi:transcriptional regulator with XRE-family HTH domain|nr:helix-turn-helix domain-containing protein [Candidatus Margulisiibacteriota bacterium]